MRITRETAILYLETDFKTTEEKEIGHWEVAEATAINSGITGSRGF